MSRANSFFIALLLVVCGSGLLSTYQLLRIGKALSNVAAEQRSSLERLRQLSTRIARQGARSDRQLKNLGGRIESLALRVGAFESEQTPKPPDGQSELAADVAEAHYDVADSTRASVDLLEVPRLTAEEKARITELRGSMPDVNENVLMSPDLEVILSHPQWNPTGRSYNQEEKDEIREWVEKFRFFAREAPFLRIKNDVQPVMAALRESSEYFEYHVDSPPDPVPGFMTHSETTDIPGVQRMYFLHPDDFPDIYHKKMVERERSLEAYVMVFHTMNGTALAAR